MEIIPSGAKLDNDQKDVIDHFASRLEKACELTALYINIKAHQKAGGRMSYTVQLRGELVKAGKHVMEKAAETTAWEFDIAVKTAFQKLEKEVKNKEAGWLEKMFKFRTLSKKRDQ